MGFDGYIFDLDGTLLDTLPDLVRLTNKVLDERGWPQRSRDEILSFVGDGGRVLLERAAPAGTPACELDDAFTTWQELYPTFGHAQTRPYDGIPEVLARLKADGAKLGVLSNKFDEAVKDVIAAQFPGMFDLARGECANIPRKPNPAGLLRMIDELGLQAGEVAYVGDSATDIEVAHNACVFSVAVTWGYQDVETLRVKRPDKIANIPDEIACRLP